MPTSRILLAWVMRTSILRNAPSSSPTRKFAVVVFSSVSLSSRSCNSVSAVVCRSQYSSTPSGRTFTPTARRSFLCSIVEKLLSWRRLFLSARILAHDRIGDRGFESSNCFPFARRPDIAAGTDLVQSPVDFEAMAIGIEKLHRDLTTRSAPPFKRDCGTLLAQPLAHVEDFGERSNLESDVMQLCMSRPSSAGANQRNRMMIGMATQERKAAGLQIFGVDFGHFKSQDLRIEKQRPL